jgi:hypothetical protein
MFGNAAKGIAEVEKAGKLTLPLEMDLAHGHVDTAAAGPFRARNCHLPSTERIRLARW